MSLIQLSKYTLRQTVCWTRYKIRKYREEQYLLLQSRATATNPPFSEHIRRTGSPTACCLCPALDVRGDGDVLQFSKLLKYCVARKMCLRPVLAAVFPGLLMASSITRSFKVKCGSIVPEIRWKILLDTLFSVRRRGDINCIFLISFKQ